MQFGDYQEKAAVTAGNSDLPVLGLGLTGEAGEVADHIKKHIGHGHDLDQGKMVSELGDVLWYLSMICTRIGVTLDMVAATNIAKLAARYPEGFSFEASINRDTTHEASVVDRIREVHHTV